MIATLVVVLVVLMCVIIGLVKLAMWSAERFSEHTDRVARRMVVEREQASQALERKRTQERAAADAEAAKAVVLRLKIKAQGWIFRVQEEPWFLEPEERLAFAKARHQNILGELGPSWCQERRSVMQEDGLRYYLEQHEPRVLAWLQARLDVIELAQRAALGLLEDEPPKPTPDEWESKQTTHARRMAEREYREAEQSIRLALDYVLRMEQLHQDLVHKHPDKAAEIGELFQQYRLLKSAPPSLEPKQPASPASAAQAPMGPEVL